MQMIIMKRYLYQYRKIKKELKKISESIILVLINKNYFCFTNDCNNK